MTATESSTGRIVGIVGGVLVLAVLVGLGVGLPKLQDDDSDSLPGGEAAAVTGEVDLPDELPGDLLAIDGDNLPDALAQQVADPAEVISGQEDAAAAVSKLFDAGATFRVYAGADGGSIATVTVLDKAPGLFTPDGPPSEQGVAASGYELVNVGPGVCARYYQQQTDEQGQPSGDPVLTRSHCQVGGGGRTFDVDMQGVAEDDVVAILDELAAA